MKLSLKVTTSELKYFKGGVYSIGPTTHVKKQFDKIPIIRDRSKTQEIKKVFVEPFLIADFPVTNFEFEKIFPKHKRCEVSLEDNQPVVDITFYEALKYCKETNCRLPTVEEWCIAAGGSEGLLASNSIKPDHDYQNFYPSNGTNCRGIYPPNLYGIYDLCGNVLEMTSTLVLLPNKIALVVAKGGSWGTCQYGVNNFMEGYVDPLLRSNRVGFRIVRNAK